MTVYVFNGPTLGATAGRDMLDAVWLPPAAQGDLYRVAVHQPRAIALIDGRFHDVPAVWHKEILWALTQGIPVYGSASMGALRAAETAAFGMIGVGRIFEAYRDGVLEDDDEVAVAHTDAENGWRATSEAMVNIRATLAAAAADGVIDADVHDLLLAHAKAAYYPDRSLPGLLAAADLPADARTALAAWLPGNRVDQKRLDACEMLAVLRADIDGDVRPPRPQFPFNHTHFFEQARRAAGDLAVSAGTQATDADVDIALPDLLDELRLDPAQYARVRDRALARGVAVAAGRRHAPPDDAALQPVIDAFRRERGLLDPEPTRRWLTDHHLTIGQFEALMREEHAVRGAFAEVDGELDIALRSQLRVDGLYTALAARVNEKRRALAEEGLSDRGVAPETAVAWYFDRLGVPVPADLTAYAQSLGYADEIAFHRAVRREHDFRTLSAHH